MSRAPCGCVYATSLNSESVRRGWEVGGYLMTPCERHGGPSKTDAELTSMEAYLLGQIDALRREYERAAAPLVKALARLHAMRPAPALLVPVTADLSQLKGGTTLSTPLESSRPRE